MCIVMCIVLFFDIGFSFKISVINLFIGSYYRTIPLSTNPLSKTDRIIAPHIHPVIGNLLISLF